MHIDWQHFSPYSALLGGGLIGLAALVYHLGCARIAGISGIVSGLLQRGLNDFDLRVAFLLGLALSPLLLGGITDIPLSLAWPTEGPLPTWGLVIAGGLVGVGARLANGCTSGHGICGLARGSLRSLVAVGIFMSVAIMVVFLLRHGGDIQLWGGV